LVKKAVPRRIGRIKDGLNAVCDGDGKPLILPLTTKGRLSDYRGAATVLQALPPDATTMIED
jgi:hypothetical protein